ncbi:histone-lysine N-methyltransferase family member SUVH9-like [Magnolia sinica]|uniref:histone-lysine N-methyltransferase family member SUVH9-like n=1 Tax=Magnolia sinica TaxID=86752 RepID=UPI00265A3C26|nr:histone-lysine N-methyltransferase family member SUVH9-like [Magnolia sinica]
MDSSITPLNEGNPHSFISPKQEPKLEPPDEEEHTPLPNPNSLKEEVSSSESDIYAEFLRISRLFHSAFAGKLGRDLAVLSPGALPIVPTNPPPSISSAIVPVTKRKRQRSTEMVRVSSLTVHDQQHFRDSVRKTRITYESLRLFLLREECPSPVTGRRTRADLKAAAAMMDRELWLNRDKRIIGSIPGVDVGDLFFFRMEMCVIGLHGQVQAGIDYVPGIRSSNGEPIATSIIVSGGYEDDEDKGNMIIYTGHGGRARQQMRHNVHQRLRGGNLALERSRHYGIEIRVIRGLKYESSPTGKVYVYDGLYRVVDYWLDVGRSGFSVYKYKLLRMVGQPEMGSAVIKFTENLRKNPLLGLPAGYMSLDISRGKENLPVYLFNDIDSDCEPMLFDYLVRPIYPPFAFQQVGGGVGCDCISPCSDGCYCVERNGGKLAYDEDGILLKGKPLIYECGSSCRCPLSCRNRVSQKGVKHRLEVFRSRETGWGVRSLDSIRAGAFICEYSGIILTSKQAEVVAMNGDSLIHPSRFPERWVEWGDLSNIFPRYERPASPLLPPLGFAMDVSSMRNVACYFSHSCSPNVLVQFVLFDHYDLSYPHLMLFAMENIPPLRELSIDYGVADEWAGKLSP